MKGIFIVLDGIGDLPNRLLGDKTPLEAAETPNLDFLANRGDLGYLYSVKPGFIPESNEGIECIFGNQLMSSTRGELEAAGTDLKLVRGDLRFRANFATVDSREKIITDRRAGRTLTTKEAEILARAVSKIELPCKFVFQPTIQHRGVLVFRGGFSENITDNDIPYRKGAQQGPHKVMRIKPLDESENAQYTANIVNEFLERSHEILENHPINEKRKQRGLLPANYILLRGAGIENPKLKFYRKWLSVAYMPLEIGFSRISGMEVFSFNYPRLRGIDAYKNLHKGLRKACKFSVKTLKKNHKKFDYAYIHIKETDLPGHDNKPIEKKEMIEYIDKKLFGFLRKFAPARKIKVLVTGDHSTPCKLKSHSADFVPVLFYPADERAPKEKRFCEKDARKGILGRMIGHQVLEKTGFAK